MRNFKLKKIIAGIAILSTGYGIALLVPPDRIPLFKDFDLSLIKAVPKNEVEDIIEKIKQENNSEKGVSPEFHKGEDPHVIESKRDENPTYLREIDLFQIPGLGADFSLRVGLPLPEAAAKKLIESYQQLSPLTVQDFRLQLVLQQGSVELRTLQNGSQKIEVVYLPECVSAGDTMMMVFIVPKFLQIGGDKPILNI